MSANKQYIREYAVYTWHRVWEIKTALFLWKPVTEISAHKKLFYLLFGINGLCIYVLNFRRHYFVSSTRPWKVVSYLLDKYFMVNTSTYTTARITLLVLHLFNAVVRIRVNLKNTTNDNLAKAKMKIIFFLLWPTWILLWIIRDNPFSIIFH